MRGLLILLTLAVIVTSVYNFINLAVPDSRGLFIWAMVFCVAVPLLAIAQAWYVAQSERTVPNTLRPSTLILSGVLLAQGAMLPLAEGLRTCRADPDPRPHMR